MSRAVFLCDTRHRVVVIVPEVPGCVHTAALLDLALPLFHGLRELGFDATLGGDAVGRLPIIVGPHMFSDDPPAGAVLYNTEQVSPESHWFGADLLGLYRRHLVWDYDPVNTRRLRALGIDAHTVPPGFHPELVDSSLPQNTDPDIDVLFYGSMNPRRTRVLNELVARGVRVAYSCNLYGRGRSEAIARSKIVLNLHYYSARIFEVARVLPLLANRRFVVTEESEHMPWPNGYVAVPYERLVDTCIGYLERADDRRRIAEAGFDAVAECPAAEMIRPCVPMLEGGAPLRPLGAPSTPGRRAS